MIVAVVLVLLVAITIVGYLTRFGDDFDPKSLRGKRVLVTGASGGVGAGIAQEYAKAGARLVLTARREPELKTMVAKCLKMGAQQADYVVCDMGEAVDRERLVLETRRLLGGLDHLILDHALFFFEYWMGSEQNMADLRRLLDVNFVAYVDIASRCLDMLTESRGHIGVLSSLDGKMVLQTSSIHSLTKFAIQGFFLTLRQEFEHRNVLVSITLIIMGHTATIFDPKSISYFGIRAATVEETARGIVKSVTERAIEVYQPVSIKMAIWLHKVFPRMIEDYTYSVTKRIIELSFSKLHH